MTASPHGRFIAVLVIAAGASSIIGQVVDWPYQVEWDRVLGVVVVVAIAGYLPGLVAGWRPRWLASLAGETPVARFLLIAAHAFCFLIGVGALAGSPDLVWYASVPTLLACRRLERATRATDRLPVAELR